MTCNEFHGALVDAARGSRGVDAVAAREHAGVCAACGEMLAEQETLTLGLADLASAVHVPDASTLEAALLAAFGRHQAQRQDTAAAPRLVWAWAAAAALAAAVALGAWWTASGRVGVSTQQAVDATSTPQIDPAPPSVDHARVEQTVAGSEPTTRSAAAGARYSIASRTRRGKAFAGRPAAEEDAPLADFIAVPGAATLPDFESGRIVRVDVPLVMLPVYGLDVPADASQVSVEADLLVGQDGLARAIRLASTNQ